MGRVSVFMTFLSIKRGKGTVVTQDKCIFMSGAPRHGTLSNRVDGRELGLCKMTCRGGRARGGNDVDQSGPVRERRQGFVSETQGN
jgi:hypothetical protein